MKIPPELLPVIQITLPIVLAVFAASWLQNRRIDDVRDDMREFRGEMREFRTEVRTELKGICEELKRQGERITRIEERLPPPLIHR